jgi:hypothetical protein
MALAESIQSTVSRVIVSKKTEELLKDRSGVEFVPGVCPSANWAYPWEKTDGLPRTAGDVSKSGAIEKTDK